MELILILIGVLAALIFGLYSIVRVLQRGATSKPGGRIWLYASVLASAGAVVVSPAGSDYLALILAAGIILIGAGLATLLLELRRKQNIGASQGLLAAGGGVLLFAAVFGQPLLSQAMMPQLPAGGFTVSSGAGGTANVINISAGGQAGQPTIIQNEAEATASVGENAVLDVLRAETGLTADELQAQIADGVTLAELVEANDGDIDAVTEAIQSAIDAQMTVDVPITTGAQAQPRIMRFSMGDMAAEVVNGEVPQSLMDSLLEALFTGTAPAAGISANPTATGTPTPSGTPLPPRPTLPTPTPTNTPFVIATATPAASGEASAETSATNSQPSSRSDCQAIVQNNLNLRTGPSVDTERQTTIPSGTIVPVAGKTEDGAWLYTTYDSFTGWVSADYVRFTGNCNAVPVEQPE